MSRAAGVQLIAGTDSYLAEQALARLLEKAVGPERDAVQVLRGDETTWARVLDAARTRSLFCARRAVVVRGAEALKGADDAVADYLDDPTPGVALILMAKPDKRRPVWKTLLERAGVVPADPLKGRALRACVAERLRERKLQVSDDGLDELIERVGQDLRRLMGEIDKLESFGAGAALGADAVAQVLGRGIARPLYRLGDAVAARQAGLALELIEELLDEGEAPLRLLGTLHRALRQVRGARALRESRATRQELAARLRVPPFKLGELLEAADRWSERELRAAFAALGRADRELKTSVEPRVALAAAVVGVCGRTGARDGSRSGR